VTEATALVLDCDGTLADTERHGHLPAFNQTFAEFGLPVRWSAEEYGRKLRIGGGKERMASLLTPEFVAAAGLPADPEALAAEVARWHRRKTEIYTARVASGALPGRPGIRRLVGEAAAAGWALVVASTSTEVSVRAVLEYVVGPARAVDFLVLAGDVVPRKKPAPDIYLLALRELGLPADRVVAVEDSRSGLLAARAAGIACVVTVNGYTEHEDLTGAAFVVSSLGEPDGEPATLIANHSAARPGRYVTLADLAAVLAPAGAGPADAEEETAVTASSGAVPPVERVVATVARTAVANEKHFGDLDAVVGDGDFGYSMARGFELVIADWDGFDRTDVATFLRKVAVVITSRIGGTSGPLWGTAFLRAAAAVTGRTEDQIDGAAAVAMLRAAAEGIKARGSAELGDKTLLDSLVPATDEIERQVAAGSDLVTTLRAAAEVARSTADETAKLQARRGRAAYTGERSIGSVDAGATAIAVMFEALVQEWGGDLT
jgi:dihydroxyacetone kinase phosphoprotein-dependent L subunit